jgi:zinc transporter ZupT
MLSTIVHSIVDGFVVGSSWSGGWSNGVKNAVGILLHELPRQISQLAALISFNYPGTEALIRQSLASAGIVLGTILGIVVAGLSSAINKVCVVLFPPLLRMLTVFQYVLSFNAAQLMFLALHELLPSLGHFTGKPTSEKISITIGLMTGLCLPYIWKELSFSHHH